MRSTDTEIEFQRRYYAESAAQYDGMHVHLGDEHFFALNFLSGMLDYLGAKSVLDVGAGTGRASTYLKGRHPELQIVAVEPVAELRAIGHAKGLSTSELIDGDATRLPFANESFDVVCEFAALHHIPEPARAVSEMLRVAKTAVFISDGNNFGQGSAVSRAFKQALNALRLWHVADLVKTKGRGYTIFEGDGLAYSYSVFNDYKLVRKQCRTVHIVNTIDAGLNPYRSAAHVALLAIK